MKYLKLFENLAPNGKTSNLGKFWMTVRNVNFISWFGNWIKNPEKFKYNLDENGEPKIFYHGTNRVFDVFSDKSHRDARNKTIGNGFFFVDNIDTAWKYAYAKINQYLLKDEFFKSLKKHYPPLLIDLVESAYSKPYSDAWNEVFKKYGENKFREIIRAWEKETSLDVNGLLDFLPYVEGAYEDDVDDRDQILNMFSNSVGSMPDWIANEAPVYHFENALPRFNVVKVFLKMDKTIETIDRDIAKLAKDHGYDSVVFSGGGLVDDIPEYIVYNTNQIKVIN